MKTIARQAVIAALNGEPYVMSLVGREAKAVAEAVNVGIDAHLEACFVPARGDRYDHVNGRLHCIVSPESLPVLVRRLTGPGPDEDDAGESLAVDVLGTLGIEVDAGCFMIADNIK